MNGNIAEVRTQCRLHLPPQTALQSLPAAACSLDHRLYFRRYFCFTLAFSGECKHPLYVTISMGSLQAQERLARLHGPTRQEAIECRSVNFGRMSVRDARSCVRDRLELPHHAGRLALVFSLRPETGRILIHDCLFMLRHLVTPLCTDCR